MKEKNKIKNNILYLWVIIIVKKAGINPAFSFFIFEPIIIHPNHTIEIECFQ